MYLTREEKGKGVRVEGGGRRCFLIGRVPYNLKHLLLILPSPDGEESGADRYGCLKDWDVEGEERCQGEDDLTSRQSKQGASCSTDYFY